MIDTHAHLDALDDDPADVVARARDAGVTRILTVGTTSPAAGARSSSRTQHDEVFAMLGIHPHEAGDATDADVAELRELLAHPKAVAVGEMGLDCFRDYAPRDEQLRLFAAELERRRRARQAGRHPHPRGRRRHARRARRLRRHASSCTASRRRTCSSPRSSAAGTSRSPAT